MENKCLNCGKPVKNKYCNVSCQNTHMWTGRKKSENYIQNRKNKIKENWKTFSVVCNKCGKVFEIKEYKVDSPKKEKYFCSRSCANGKKWNDEDRRKKSESAIKSDKVKMANIENGKKRKNFYFSNGIKKERIERISTKCLYCGEDIIHKITQKRKYHQKCWAKISGGIKKGSSRGKCGWYKGYWCDSSYELAWVIYSIDHKIKFERNYEGFDYVFNGETHKYYPDFIKENKLYVEIKNYKSELTDAKIEYFPYKIEVLYKENIKKDILPYVIEVYGKNFTDLYEKNK